MSGRGSTLEPERLAARYTPIGRAGTPDEAPAAVRFLPSPEVSYITGQSLVVDGDNILQQKRSVVPVTTAASTRATRNNRGLEIVRVDMATTISVGSETDRTSAQLPRNLWLASRSVRRISVARSLDSGLPAGHSFQPSRSPRDRGPCRLAAASRLQAVPAQHFQRWNGGTPTPGGPGSPPGFGPRQTTGHDGGTADHH